MPIHQQRARRQLLAVPHSGRCAGPKFCKLHADKDPMPAQSEYEAIPTLHDPEPQVSWQVVDRPPPLLRGDLHLWLIRTDGDARVAHTQLGLLGEPQRLRAERMIHERTRTGYIQAQAGLRRILGAYLGCHPAEVAFRYGPAGKPGLAVKGADHELNLTTTGDIALVAVRRGQAVGVDCERIRPRLDIDGIATRMFDPTQLRTLSELPESMRLHFFYRAWTALEADCKCDGRGLFRPRAPGAEPPLVAHFSPASGYVAAVASASLPETDRWRTLELIADHGKTD